MMNTNDRRIYLAGAPVLAWFPMLAIAGVAAGAILARDVPMVAKWETQEATKSASLPPRDNGDTVERKVETLAGFVGPLNRMARTERETSAPTTTPAERAFRRASYGHRAAALPTALQDRVARSGTICEVRPLQMGPIGRSVRYCHF